MRLTITKKLAMVFTLIIIMMSTIGIISISELNNVKSDVKGILDLSKTEKALHNFQTGVMYLLMNANDYLLTGKKLYYDEYLSFNKKTAEEISTLDQTLTDPTERKKLFEIKSELDSVNMAVPKLFSVAERKIKDSVSLLIYELDYNFDNKINQDVDDFITEIHARSQSAYADVYKEREEAFLYISITIILAIAVSVLVSLLSMKRISKPILKLVNLAQKIAARDFDVQFKVDRKDEIGMLIVAFNAMAEEIGKRYEELENFSYIAAHDLKSPLVAIVGSAEVLYEELDGKLNKDQTEFLGNIINSGQKMSSLITDLLNFAMAGKVEFSKEPVSMNQMLSEIKSELSFTIKQKKVQLDIKSDLPAFICDPARFRQVWNNLISNSIKYNENPQPTIEIGLGDNPEYENRYCFYVRDNGIGIDENYLDKIFNPFQRAKTDKRYEGTGIGLAIVKRIIEFHNGEIWVESQKNRGSVFYFTIPKQLVQS